MVSIGLGVFIVCVIYVAYWSVQNDAAKSIEDQLGFIRMRRPKKPRAQPAKHGDLTTIRQADGPGRQ